MWSSPRRASPSACSRAASRSATSSGVGPLDAAGRAAAASSSLS